MFSFSFKRLITSSHTSWFPALTPNLTVYDSFLASAAWFEFEEVCEACPHAANVNPANAVTNNFLMFIYKFLFSLCLYV